MTILSWFLIAFSEACSIAGQICFKIAMGRHWHGARAKAWFVLTAGVASSALGFFVWLGLLSTFDLSLLYPLEGISRVGLLLAAAFFLREEITLSLWLGVLLISSGVVLVATS